MMILSSKEFDIDGFVTIQEKRGSTQTRGSIRRVSRTATLDGGVALDDAGYAEGDRTFNIEAVNISESDLEILHRIHSLYSIHRCATNEGIFEGVIEEISISDGEISITFLVSSKLSQ